MFHITNQIFKHPPIYQTPIMSNSLQKCPEIMVFGGGSIRIYTGIEGTTSGDVYHEGDGITTVHIRNYHSIIGESKQILQISPETRDGR